MNPENGALISNKTRRLVDSRTRCFALNIFRKPKSKTFLLVGVSVVLILALHRWSIPENVLRKLVMEQMDRWNNKSKLHYMGNETGTHTTQPVSIHFSKESKSSSNNKDGYNQKKPVSPLKSSLRFKASTPAKIGLRSGTTSRKILSTARPTTQSTTREHTTQGISNNNFTQFSCNFPHLDPYDNSIKKYLTKYPTLNCDGSSPKIVEVNGLKLTINSRHVKRKLHLNKNPKCRYRNMMRISGNDFKVDYSNWSPPFTKSIAIHANEATIQVDCHHRGKLVSRSFHAMVRKKEEIETKRKEDYRRHMEKNKPKETLSVLFIGLDGMSVPNFERTMPKTKKFIMEEMNAIEYHKYNKVGENTFPNILPLLTGWTENEPKDQWTRSMHFDKINHLFLWEQYRKAGYRSAVMFDFITTGFHYLKQGWAEDPADYYPRTIVLASNGDKFYRRRSANCMGDSPEVTELFDYWLQLATLFNNSQSTPYFAYNFMTRLSHDVEQLASAGDEIYLELFQEFKRRNVLNNTLIIFFSDHGERFGSIRNSPYGVLSSRMPYLYFIFPPWFEEKYPLPMSNFRENADRLMTTFDIYETLKDLLYFKGIPQHFDPNSRGISLFSEIPYNRTCESADIPLRFCLCTSFLPERKVDKTVKQHVANHLVKVVVGMTEKFRDKCVILKLKEIVRIVNMDSDLPLKEGESLYIITLKTTPGDAIFEATILHNYVKAESKIMGNIVRLNLYRGQAECILSHDHRPFCYCSSKG